MADVSKISLKEDGETKSYTIAANLPEYLANSIRPYTDQSTTDSIGSIAIAGDTGLWVKNGNVFGGPTNAFESTDKEKYRLERNTIVSLSKNNSTLPIDSGRNVNIDVPITTSGLINDGDGTDSFSPYLTQSKGVQNFVSRISDDTKYGKLTFLSEDDEKEVTINSENLSFEFRESADSPTFKVRLPYVGFDDTLAVLSDIPQVINEMSPQALYKVPTVYAVRDYVNSTSISMYNSLSEVAKSGKFTDLDFEGFVSNYPKSLSVTKEFPRDNLITHDVELHYDEYGRVTDDIIYGTVYDVTHLLRDDSSTISFTRDFVHNSTVGSGSANVNVVLGENNTISDNSHTYIIGDKNISIGFGDIFIGHNLQGAVHSDDNSTIYLGRYNKLQSPFLDTDRLLVVGNGTSSHFSTAMYMKNDGTFIFNGGEYSTGTIECEKIKSKNVIIGTEDSGDVGCIWISD